MNGGMKTSYLISILAVVAILAMAVAPIASTTPAPAIAAAQYGLDDVVSGLQAVIPGTLYTLAAVPQSKAFILKHTWVAGVPTDGNSVIGIFLVQRAAGGATESISGALIERLAERVIEGLARQ